MKRAKLFFPVIALAFGWFFEEAAMSSEPPPAVGASTAQPSKRDEIQLVYAKVNHTDAQDDYGIYTKLYDFTDEDPRTGKSAGTEIIIKMRGQEYELKGQEALGFLVREGYVVERRGVGMIATERLKQFLGIAEEDEEKNKSEGGLFGQDFDGPLIDSGPVY